MTIGIGVIGTTSTRGDTLILVSDTLGTVGDTSSTGRCHKMFLNPNDGVYIVAAGCMNRASELVPRIVAEIHNSPSRKSDAIYHAIHGAIFGYHKWRAAHEVTPKYNICDFEDKEQAYGLIRDECWRLNLGCDLIVGAFDDDGRALLFETYGVAHTDKGDSPSTLEYVNNATLPGAIAIGSGRDGAAFWLDYREQTLSYSAERSAYHAYEAKRMAENSVQVNEKIEMLIATSLEHHWIRDEHPASGRWSLDAMSKSFAKYGPVDTATVNLLV